MDFEWIDDTPADVYEYGEELYFTTSTWCYVTGQFLRQEGEDIIVKVTSVDFGPIDWIGEEMKFRSEHICEKVNLDSLFTSYTFEWDAYDYTDEELSDYDNDIEIPRVIGKVNTVVKGINHIGKKDCRPRDGPTNIVTNYSRKITDGMTHVIPYVLPISFPIIFVFYRWVDSLTFGLKTRMSSPMSCLSPSWQYISLYT